MKLGENNYLMRWVFSLNFIRIGQKLWTFYLRTQILKSPFFLIKIESTRCAGTDLSTLILKMWNLSTQVKNPQFLPNPYETWRKYSPHEVIIFPKFHKDWEKIVDFLPEHLDFTFSRLGWTGLYTLISANAPAPPVPTTSLLDIYINIEDLMHRWRLFEWVYRWC